MHLEETKGTTKSWEATYYDRFNAPTKSYEQICDIIKQQIESDNSFINNLTISGMDYSDSAVTEYFTSTPYLGLIDILNSYFLVKDQSVSLHQYIKQAKPS